MQQFFPRLKGVVESHSLLPIMQGVFVIFVSINNNVNAKNVSETKQFYVKKNLLPAFCNKLFLSYAPPNIAQNILKFAMNLTEKLKIFICNKKQSCSRNRTANNRRKGKVPLTLFQKHPELCAIFAKKQSISQKKNLAKPFSKENSVSLLTLH